MYQVPCNDCLCVYTGETESRYGVREKAHERGVSSLEKVKFRWVRKKDSVSELHNSAITDHVARNNHTIDWEGVKFPSRDSDTTKRGIWVSIAIKKTGTHTINMTVAPPSIVHRWPYLLLVKHICTTIGKV